MTLKLTEYAEQGGICWWCGGELPPRRRRYCCNDCANEYWRHFNWWDASAWAREREKCCRDCGSPPPLPAWLDGIHSLDVHHIIPLNGQRRDWNILNLPENLVVLCRSCHFKRQRNNSLDKKFIKAEDTEIELHPEPFFQSRFA